MSPAVAAVVETAGLMLAAYVIGCGLGFGARAVVMRIVVRPTRAPAPALLLLPPPDPPYAIALAKVAVAAMPVTEAATLRDLTLIRGIGPRLAAILNELGIDSVERIATLTGDDVARIEARVGFPGRVARDNWIEQARWLLGEDEAA